MGKILVIAEKPSVAADYAKALRQTTRNDGYFEGDKYVITWAYGHIVSRKELYEYDGNINSSYQNKEHVLETLPYFPSKHILKASVTDVSYRKLSKNELASIKGRNELITKQLNIIKSLFNRNDIDYVVNGCDSGREGEAIFCQIYDYLNCTLPVMRLWLSSNVTEDIIREFSNLKPGKDYENLKKASYARAEMDWEHGLNLSALYSSLYGASLSVGRVQTPLVNIILERENEIKNFTPKDYYLLDANFSTKDNFNYKGRLVIDNSLGDIVVDGKITDISKINSILEAVENKEGFVKSIEKKKKKESPKLLYNLSALQIEMSAKHKMRAQQVLDIAQSLYEKHKLTTYPRTSSQYLNVSMKSEIFERLDYLPREYNNAIEYAKNSKCFYEPILNDAKVEDHYALIPTKNSKNFDFSKLSKEEMIVYTAITKRFISLFMPDYEYESTILITNVSGYDFKTTGKKVLKQGWRALYSSDMDTNPDEDNEKEDNNQNLTYDFKENLPILCGKCNNLSKKTTPPRRYTDGTLIAMMEIGGPKNIGITDQNKLDMLKEKGLGTDATRAGLITNIINRGYVEIDKKSYLIPTKKGEDFMSKITIDSLKSPEITGEWEYKLKLVEKGKLLKEDLISEARSFLTNCVDNIKKSYKEGDKIISGNTMDFKCPLCGGDVIKTPKAYFCSKGQNVCKFVVFTNILGKELKDTDVKDICTKGTTKLIKGFSNPKKTDENGKPTKFDAYLIYDKEENKLKFNFPNKSQTEKKVTEFKCPKCGEMLYEFETGYGCSGYSKGCKFSFFKNLFSRKLTEKDVKSLLEEGSTEVFEDLYNPKNPSKKFKAKLVLKDFLVEIAYLNENNEVNVGKPSPFFCPCCKKTMLEYDSFYKCDSCKFIIGKVVAGVTLSNEDIKSICVNKQSPYLSFISKSGKEFKACLFLNEKTKKLEFKLESKASSYSCPLCKSEVGEREKGYSCLKCGLTVWKEITGVKLSDETIAEVFKNKQTSDYLEFVSAKGNPFKAKLVVNTKTKKVEFMFEPRK